MAPAGAAEAPLLLHDGPQGATCHYYDEGAGMRWKHRMGDWRDADGAEQGNVPFASARGGGKGSSVELDLTRVHKLWTVDRQLNAGVLIRSMDDSRGVATFASSQAEDVRSRPVLSITRADGTSEDISAAGDATLVCSTVKSLGSAKTLRVGGGYHIVIRFDLPPRNAKQPVTKAVLRLTTFGKQFGPVALGVFLLDPPLDLTPPAPQLGLAAAYPGDSGIERDRNVLLAEHFESSTWTRNWSYARQTGTFDVVSDDDALKFQPLRGRALRVNVEKGQHLGLNAGYRFRGKQGSEPEEIYFRYYLRFADDWNQTLDGGKMPGIAGTYDRGGWGGRKADGLNGWSMRGGFSQVIPEGHPYAGGTLLGTYAYHARAQSKYGAHWPWSAGRPGIVRNNRWYCVEQYFRVNTPGADDGILRVWLDGVLAFERTDIRVRDIDSIKIEQVWLNVYHGGTARSPRDQHVYIDNVVIARSYIGPMRAP